VCEVEDTNYVFEPALESHTTVSLTEDGWKMLEVIDDFDEAMEIYPKG